jgi:hypothetical protein
VLVPKPPHYLDKARDLLNKLLPSDAQWALLVQEDREDSDTLSNVRILTTEDSNEALARGLRAVAAKLTGDC